MVSEQRIQNMEEEVTLLKAEVKATLVDIRELLLNTDIDTVLSTPKSATVLQPRSINHSRRGYGMNGIDDDQRSVPKPSSAKSGAVEFSEDTGYCRNHVSGNLLGKQEQRHHGTEDTVDPNLMASLLRWVVLTRKHIGDEELDAFMEICRLSGGLPERARQLVSRIAETVRDDASIDENSYSKWSDLMLQLHGIISPACFFSESQRHSTEV